MLERLGVGNNLNPAEMAGFFKSSSSIEQQENELIVTVIPCGVDQHDVSGEEREKPFEI